MSGASFRVAVDAVVAAYPGAVRPVVADVRGWLCSAESGAVTGTVVHAGGGFIG